MANSRVINSALINSYKSLIKAFSKCPIDIQRIIIVNPCLKFAKLISELSVNLLYNTLDSSDNCIRDLKKYKKLILYFSNRKISLTSKAHALKKNRVRHRLIINKLFKCILEHI